MNNKTEKINGGRQSSLIRKKASPRSHYRHFYLFILLTLLFPLTGLSSSGFVNNLRGNGYSLIPAPQEVLLTGKNIRVDGSWKITSKAGKGNIALIRLEDGAKNFLDLEFTGKGVGEIVLEVDPQIIKKSINKDLASQGYQIEIAPGEIKISGNGEEGLFYGVQSLLQLLRPAPGGGYLLPTKAR